MPPYSANLLAWNDKTQSNRIHPNSPQLRNIEFPFKAGSGRSWPGFHFREVEYRLGDAVFLRPNCLGLDRDETGGKVIDYLRLI